MKQIIIRYGLYTGIIITLFMVISSILFMQNQEMSSTSMFIGMTVIFGAFLLVFFAIKKYKETIGNGTFSFKNGFLIGLGVAIIASTIYTIVWAIEYNMYFPDFMDKWLAYELKTAKPEELAAKTAELKTMQENYKNPILFVLYTIMEVLPIGILYSLVGALIFRKK